MLLPGVLAVLLGVVLLRPDDLPGWVRYVVLGSVGGYCGSLVIDLVRLVRRRLRGEPGGRPA